MNRGLIYNIHNIAFESDGENYVVSIFPNFLVILFLFFADCKI